MRELPLTVVGQPEKTNACGSCNACCEGSAYMQLNEKEADQIAENTELTAILPAMAGQNWRSRRNREEAKRIIDELGASNSQYTAEFILRSMKKGVGFYKRTETCGWLNANGDCSIYDERPEICRKFQKDSFGCDQIRQQ